jgi:membrane fusion protein (multidrug efflux system)
MTRGQAVWPVLGLLAVFVLGCGEEAKKSPGALKVKLAEAVAVTINEEAAFDAVLAAKETIEVRAQVRGYLKERLFEEGEQIKQGDLLYKLDDRDLRAGLEAARANTAKAETTWKNDETNKKRYLALAATGAVSLQERDNAVARAAASQAAYETAKAQEDRAAVDLEYAAINAPISGFISRSLVEVGALVESGSTLLATIYRLDPIRAEFSLTDKEFTRFSTIIRERGGNSDDLKFLLYLGDERRLYPHEGVLEMADPVVDPKTNTMGVRAEFHNPEYMVRPGQFVNVVGVLGQREVVTVPDEAVVDVGGGGKAVFIVDENSILVVLPVEAGRRDGDRRVILEGLSAGQKVVVEGLVTAQPGLPVEVVVSGPTSSAP